jgi:hypothetical protein
VRTCFYSCVGSGASSWLWTCPTTPIFHLSLAHFLITLRTRLGLPHPIITHLSQCQCGHTIDNLGTHLLQCPCKSERIVAHDTFWDIVTAIILESGTHVQREASHLFLCHTWWWMDILITKDYFWTLMDIVIVDLICTDMVQQTLTMTTHVTMMDA